MAVRRLSLTVEGKSLVLNTVIDSTLGHKSAYIYNADGKY